MATGTKTRRPAPEPEPEEVDLFDEEDGDSDVEEDLFADFDDDLLDEVVEDDSEGWVPDEPGDGIQGVVLKVGETRSDFDDNMVPTVTLQTREGKFRVIGYGAVLRREMLDADPKVGDLMAFKYFGEKPIKKGKFAGKMYKHFGVAIRRANKDG